MFSTPRSPISPPQCMTHSPVFFMPFHNLASQSFRAQPFMHSPAKTRRNPRTFSAVFSVVWPPRRTIATGTTQIMRLKSSSTHSHDKNRLAVTISREMSGKPRQTTPPAQPVGRKDLEGRVRISGDWRCCMTIARQRVCGMCGRQHDTVGACGGTV